MVLSELHLTVFLFLPFLKDTQCRVDPIDTLYINILSFLGLFKLKNGHKR